MFRSISLLIAIVAGVALVTPSLPAQDVYSAGDSPTLQGSVSATEGNPNCPPPVLPNGVIPKNWSCKTGTQGAQGNPFCAPPVLPDGTVPKNWSCKTQTQPAISGPRSYQVPTPGPAGGIGYRSGPNACLPQGPGGYDYCANGPGARLPPGCTCGGPALARNPPATNWTGYVDSHGESPATDSLQDGRANFSGRPRDNGIPAASNSGAAPPEVIHFPVQTAPVSLPTVSDRQPSTGGSGANPTFNASRNADSTRPTPLQGGIKEVGQETEPTPESRASIRVAGHAQGGYYDRKRPYYNGVGDSDWDPNQKKYVPDTYTVDLSKEPDGTVRNPRHFTNQSGKKLTAAVTPNYNPGSGFLQSLTLHVQGKRDLVLKPSDKPLVTLFRGY